MRRAYENGTVREDRQLARGFGRVEEIEEERAGAKKRKKWRGRPVDRENSLGQMRTEPVWSKGGKERSGIERKTEPGEEVRKDLEGVQIVLLGKEE